MVHSLDEGIISISIIIREALISMRSNPVEDCCVMRSASVDKAINALSSYQEGHRDVVVV